MKLINTALLALSPLLLTASAHPVAVTNAGVGGHNTRHGVRRIASLLHKVRPQILVIGYGANDTLNSRALVPPEEFCANLSKMIEEARKRDVRIIVLNTVNPIIESYLTARHSYEDGIQPLERVKKYNQLIRETAKKEKVLLNDFYAAMEKHGGATEKKESLVRNQANSRSKDGLHLTAAGMKLLAETISECLKTEVRPGDRILCLGDSITWGAGVVGSGTTTGETYPAWLETILNHNLGLKSETTPPPYQAPIPMKIPNATFLADNPGEGAYGWVNDEKAGKAVVAEEGKEKFLRLEPSRIAFCRTELFPAQAGKWSLQLKSRGKGAFQPAVTLYGKGKTQYLPLAEDFSRQTPEWRTYEFSVNIPEGTDNISLSLRQKEGIGDFDDLSFTATAQKQKMFPAIELKGKGIAIRFLEPKDGGGIQSIVNAEGKEFVNRTPSPALWSMTLKKIHPKARTEKVVFLSIDPERDDGGLGKNSDDSDEEQYITAKTPAECSISRKPNSIRFEWNKMDIGDEKGVLDVWAEAFLDKGGNESLFRGGFVNRSNQYTVFYFQMPQLGGIGALDGKPENDFLATPFFNGRLIRNPLEKGLLGNSRIFQPNRSGHSMQMDVFTNGKDSLLLCVLDPEQAAKRFQLTADSKNGFAWSPVHIPDNMKKIPQEWEIPYLSTIRPFQGDWYDGCQIYRQWALSQFWCKEGPLVSRESTPVWFKEILEWCQFGVTQYEEQKSSLLRFREETAAYPVGIWLSWWGLNNQHFDSGNPDRFPLTELDKEVLNMLKENNFSVMGYIQCVSWGDSSPS